MTNKHIEKAKTKNYILYAAKEISFIVIGILIAIQLNNWNDNRKKTALAIDYLKGIKEDLAVDTFKFKQIVAINKEELSLLATRLKVSKYEDLAVDSLNKFIINSSSMEYKINSESYQKILNIGLAKASNNQELNKQLDYYYNSINSRFSAFVNYDYEQTNLERFYWFYNQDIAEMLLTPNDTFPFIAKKTDRQQNLVKLFKSAKARNYMRAEYYRTLQLIEFVEIINRRAKKLITEIDKEIAKEL